MTHDNTKALFPGTFNPFTIGHASIVERGLSMFNSIVIAIGINADKPADAADAEHRAQQIARLYADDPRVEVCVYSGLTAPFAVSIGATHLLRGVRSVKDFEYERDMADINRRIAHIETVLLYALPELSCISSSMVRDLEAHGYDVRQYLPTEPK